MSLFQIVLLLALVTVTLGALRSARGTFVDAVNERERLTHIVAGLVVAEPDGDPAGTEAGLTITSHGGDLCDLDLFAYSATGRPQPITAQRHELPLGQVWTVTGPDSPARDTRWVLWWTCPSGYRWRLTVHDQRQHLQCVARPPGSAPGGNNTLATWRNTAWPYTYTSPNPRRAHKRTHPPGPHAEIAANEEPLEETTIGDWWESVAEAADADPTRPEHDHAGRGAG